MNKVKLAILMHEQNRDDGRRRDTLFVANSPDITDDEEPRDRVRSTEGCSTPLNNTEVEDDNIRRLTEEIARVITQ